MDFFRCLEKEQRRTPFERSEEMKFFLRYSGILTDFPTYAKFVKATKPFDVIRANILIRALRNKYAIEIEFSRALKLEKKAESEDPILNAIERTATFLEKLPFYSEGARRIFVPVFPRSLNEIYDGDFAKLLEANYKSILAECQPLCIDPFDEYGSAIYDSYFTKLVLIAKDENIRAFYDYDSLTVYFVNRQGRLENQICLFDRGIHRRNTNHMMERLLPVVEAYLAFDREKMIRLLVENKLISSSFVERNIAKETELYRKMEKHNQ